MNSSEHVDTLLIISNNNLLEEDLPLKHCEVIMFFANEARTKNGTKTRCA